MPNNALAEAVGIAPSTCLMRVRRLQDSHVITGYRAEIALEPLGRSLQALISVRLQAHARSNIGDFTQRFATLPGVLNVFFLAGADDFLVHVAASTPDDLREFVVRNLSASREVASTETSLIFEHISSDAGALLGPDA